MTRHEALTGGLLLAEKVGDRTILVDPTRTYVVWHEAGRALPWRWARRVWLDDGQHGQQHGGASTLDGVLLATAVLVVEEVAE